MERLHVKGMELKDGHDEPDRHDHHKNGMVSRMWTVLAWRKTLDFLGRKMWLASDMQGMDHNNNQHETSSSLHSTFTSNVINTINTINSNNNNTHSPLQPPADVLLYYYNASDFEFLVSNLTNNTQAAQGLIVLTASSTLQSWIIIPLRMMVIVMDVILFFGLVIFRNKEPVKSKFIPSMLLLFVNFIGNLQSIVDRIPVVKLLFQTYWNEYLLEKLANPLLDASLYFSEHLFEPYQLPRWFIDWAVFTNVYCYLVAYGLYTISILGVVIYNIQLSRFLLLTFLKERKDQFRNAMIAFKEKQLEKWKNVKMQKLQEKERQKNTETGGVNLSSLEKRKSVKSLSRASVSSLSSSSVDVTSQTHLVPTINLAAVQSVSSSTSTDSLPAVTPRSSMIYNTMQGTDEALTDDSFDTEDMVVDLTSDDDAVSTSLEEISKFGKGVKILKFLERYRLIDIGIYTMWLVIWWILVSIAIFTVSTDTTGAIFPKWNLIRGYCSGNAYLNVITFALIMFSVIFLVAMISWFFDLFVSIYKYVKRRKADQLNSVKTSNFLFYHFVETDPFVYRATFLMNMIFSFIGAVIALFFWNSTNFVGSLIIDLCFTLFVNFLGGCVANPGITVARALYDYVKTSSHRSKKTNSTQDQPSKSTTIKNLKELVHAPSSSDCLNYIIAHAKERELFYSHLREEFSSENLLFTEALTSLKKINDKFMRRKMMKLKEIVKLYLSESESVFEVNLPSVLVRNQLKPYFVVTKFMDEQNMSVNDLPKMLKDVAAQMFPNVTQDVETKVRNAYTEICHPQFLSGVQTEVYKNLLDSYFRFMGSRKWLNFVKENNV
ncbi:hypothetical protein C9374_003557 [Naegleria lovaniensis]|uniref:RGS domain-containing protein n=1 Tax=Naegleria lovaniensis TaxID=51637 RepID=A0AA88H3D5_NAELO|nr:uncharacterized protein C9374_003557 [Naegleria lovaniensis]KAG2393793.1 hypothetical protein C9374_003557 [Naegleria lovaniensis]